LAVKVRERRLINWQQDDLCPSLMYSWRKTSWFLETKKNKVKLLQWAIYWNDLGLCALLND
jgi:hypothetical protein